METFTMENDRLLVAIADFGAELISIFDKHYQREIIWQADPVFWKRHAPVLFPNVGKYYHGEFLYNGKHYKEGQHGFARDMVFDRISSGKDYVTYRLASDEDTKRRYPFDFVLEITHRLEGQDIEVLWKVVNIGESPMYFTIGGHPAFNVPVLPDTKFSDYYLTFAEDKETLEYILIDLNTGTAVPDQIFHLELNDHMYRLRDDMFDRDALVFDNGQIGWAGIALPDGTPYVSMTCEGFPNFGIWSVPGAPYVCLEPWCGRCDNRGFEGDISDKAGINRLESGQLFEKSYKITIW
ncbi:MAG: aldose 1-epimerase family protein [Coprococcus sp.]